MIFATWPWSALPTSGMARMGTRTSTRHSTWCLWTTSPSNSRLKFQKAFRILNCRPCSNLNSLSSMSRPRSSKNYSHSSTKRTIWSSTLRGATSSSIKGSLGEGTMLRSLFKCSSSIAGGGPCTKVYNTMKRETPFCLTQHSKLTTTLLSTCTFIRSRSLNIISCGLNGRN